MVRRASLVVAAFLVVTAARADPLPTRSARNVSYEIDVQLDWPAKRIRASQVLTWRNRTRDTVRDIWLHLYWNAFRDDESTFALERHDRRSARPRGLGRGEIVIDRMRVKGGPALSPRFEHPDDDNESDRTVVAADLPTPVPPGGEVTLEIDWHSEIPRGAARTGWGPGFVFAVQWFPKPGVYEEGRGWNCHQYHASTEYFADFATFDVTLHAPPGWKVGATGREVEVDDDVHRFVAEDVHDFAWTMTDRHERIEHRFRPNRPRFPREARRLRRVLGRSAREMALREVEVILFIPDEIRGRADRYLDVVDVGLELFGLRYGRYPYDVLTVVLPPKAGEFACCMEYPTLFTTLGGLVTHGQQIEWVTMHELGHQYFHGLLGSNEFEAPWLDEGFTTYATMRALETGYPPQRLRATYLELSIARFQPWALPEKPGDPFLAAGLLAPLGAHAESPLAFARDAVPVAAWPDVTLPEPRSEGAPFGSLARYREDPRRGELSRVGFRQLDHLAYRINSYSKTSVMLRTLERYLPNGTMDRILRTYAERFRFREPRGEDFERVASEVAGRDLAWFFDQAVRSARVLDYGVGTVRERGAGERRRTEVLVRRQGEFVVPVEVLVRFEDGRTVLERWDGQGRFTTFHYDGMPPVRAVVVDPRAVWWLDVDLSNNSWRARPDPRPARRWALRLLLWVQHAMRFAAGLS